VQAGPSLHREEADPWGKTWGSTAPQLILIKRQTPAAYRRTSYSLCSHTAQGVSWQRGLLTHLARCSCGEGSQLNCSLDTVVAAPAASGKACYLGVLGTKPRPQRRCIFFWGCFFPPCLTLAFPRQPRGNSGSTHVQCIPVFSPENTHQSGWEDFKSDFYC
jgi:hypothetical protein